MQKKELASCGVKLGELAFAFNRTAKIMKESSIKWSAAMNGLKPKKN